MLHVQNQELILFVCPVQWILQHQVLDVDQTFLEIVLEQCIVFFFLCSIVNLLNLILFLYDITQTIPLIFISLALFVIHAFDACFVVLKHYTLCLDIGPG